MLLKRHLLFIALLFITDFGYYHLSAQSTIPFEDFVGTNIRREDPLNRLDAVGFVREYHLWEIDEYKSSGEFAIMYDTIIDMGDTIINEFCQQISEPKIYPNNEYYWSPISAPGQVEADMKTFYEQVRANNRGLCATMQGTLKILLDENDPNYSCNFEFGAPPVFNENYMVNSIPIEVAGQTICTNNLVFDTLPSTIIPESYKWHADYLTQFANYFGATTPFAPASSKSQGEGALGTAAFTENFYIENFNEQDKFWCRPDNAAQFTAEEYAAMSSADFDGNQGEFTGKKGDADDAPEYNLGVGGTNGGSAKFVMGGLLDIEATSFSDPITYLTDMKTWLDTERTGSADDKFFFDVLNFHHYRFSNFLKRNSHGLAPEEKDNLSGSPKDLFEKLDELKTVVIEGDLGIDMTNREIWLSEYGYDTNPFSDVAAIPDITIQLENPIGTISPITEISLREEVVKPIPCSEFDGTFLLYKSIWGSIGTKDRIQILDAIEEAQGRWLVRSFIETKRANWDRMMQFCIRDEVTITTAKIKPGCGGAREMAPDGYRFRSSGLVKDRANGYEPKKSYYYVSTMKSVLEGTTGIQELVHEDNGLRVLEFTGGAVPVFAVWNASATLDATLTKNLNELMISGVSEASTYISLEAPFTKGERSVLSDHLSDSDQISVTDKPFFIIAEDFVAPEEIYDTCAELVKQGCNHVRLSVDNVPGEFDRYIVHYASVEDVEDLNNPDVSELTLYADDISGRFKEIVVTDFQEPRFSSGCENSVIYIRGVKEIKDDVTGKVISEFMSDWCPIEVGQKNCSCSIDIDPITEVTITPPGPSNANRDKGKELFVVDYNLCNLPKIDREKEWVDFGPGIGTESEALITLNTSSIIDGLFLFDGSSNNILEIFFDTGTGFSTVPDISYDTRAVDEWVSFANIETLIDSEGEPLSVQRIKVIRNDNPNTLKQAIISKMFFLCHEGEGLSDLKSEQKEVVKNIKIEKVTGGAFRLAWENPYLNLPEREQPREMTYIIDYALEVDREGNFIKPKRILLEKYEGEKEFKIEIFDREYSEKITKDLVDIRVSPTACNCIDKHPDDGGIPDERSDENPVFQEIADLDFENLYVRPNPMHDRAWLETEKPGYSNIAVFRLDGTKAFDIPINPENTSHRISLKGLPDGLYLLQIQGESKRWLSTKVFKGNY